MNVADGEGVRVSVGSGVSVGVRVEVSVKARVAEVGNVMCPAKTGANASPGNVPVPVRWPCSS